MKNRISFIAD